MTHLTTRRGQHSLALRGLILKVAKVFYPNRSRLIAIGFSAVADVPVIFDRGCAYQRAHSRYLRERATGEHYPNIDESILPRNRPRKTTLINIANHLAIFVDWCDDNQLNWQTIDYNECLILQNAMATGKWSPSGRKLTRETANIRVDEITSFLQWAAERKLRGTFSVPVRTSSRTFSTGASAFRGHALCRRRAGRLKVGSSQSGSFSWLPTGREIAAWLDAVRARRGEAKYLACRFILETGVRLHELIAINEEQIPSAEELQASIHSGRTTTSIKLTVTKGDRPRTIDIPIIYAHELRTWADSKRLRLRYLYYKRHNIHASARLFLSDARGYEGQPINGPAIYECFAKVEPRPNKWFPHFGRHTYACLTVLETLRNEATAAGSEIGRMGVDWINSRGQWILHSLQLQLGHLSDETTKIYLRWLSTSIGIGDVSVGWHNYLSMEGDPE